MNLQIGVDNLSAQKISKDIIELAYQYESVDEFYKRELLRIKDSLFFVNPQDQYHIIRVTPIFFVEALTLFRILNHLQATEGTFSIETYMHPQILTVSGQKLANGHSADAVESALKEICSVVRKYRKGKGAVEITSDSDMLRKTFGTEAPLLQFNALSSVTDKNVQEGYTHLFAGCMQAIRNQSAHENLVISREDAVRKLMLASDLMYKLQEALSLCVDEK